MYGRKLKKKLSRGPSNVGASSNWGPRIALEAQAEQEAKIYGRRPPAAATDPTQLPAIFKNPYAQSNNNQVLYSSKYGKLGPCGSQHGSEVSSTVKKPLTVIIPNQKDRRYDYAYNHNSGSRDRGGDDSERRRNGHHSYDSLPSTETWRSSDSEREEEANEGPLFSDNNDENRNNGKPARRRQVPSSEMRSLPKESETIEVSIPSRRIRQVPEGRSGVVYAEYHLDLDSESSSAGSLYSRQSGKAVYPKEVKVQPTFGIQMVYVPMERNGSAQNQRLLESGNNQPAEANKSTANGSNRHSESSGFEPKDPDGDSLLESFDSVLFKPNPGATSNRSGGSASSPGTSSGLGSSSSQTNHHDSFVFKSGLPPKNSTADHNGAGNKKNLRFSDHLEVQAPNSVSPRAGGNAPSRKTSFCKCNGHGGTFLAAAILPCGHAKAHDNYSTLSSVDSFRDRAEQDGNTKAEKSALQQLRDLSILIGGSFHNSNTQVFIPARGQHNRGSAQGPNNSATPSPTDSGSKLRKTSTTTATSGDSGKGCSGSAQTQSASNRSNASPPVDEEDDACIFRPDCKECLSSSGIYRNPFSPGCAGQSLQVCAGQSPPGGASQYRSSCAAQSPTRVNLPSNYGFRKPKVLRRKSKVSKNGKSKTKMVVVNRGIRSIVPEIRSYENNNSLSSICDCNCSCPVVGPPSERENLTKTKFESVEQGVRNRSDGAPLGAESGELNSNFSSIPLLLSNAHLSTIAEEDEYGNTHDGGSKSNGRNAGHGGVTGGHGHSHPKCWLAPDPGLGWSDLESLYSANFKSSSPLEIDGECWKCWREMSEYKRNEPSNTTIDRTKRMFIWLNRRPKEFSAPWWEAKKEASMKWILTKAFRNLPPTSPQLCPYRESKKDKLQVRIKDEVIRDLTNGKLYTMALLNLFSQSSLTAPTSSSSSIEQDSAQAQLRLSLSQLRPGEKLSLWEIIKVLCRKGVYVAQPSDMKLTEGTLRQRRPLRVAAHIALIEAVMSLYASEMVRRERVSLILNSFGHSLRPEAQNPEELIISWINSAVTTLKTYILSTNQIHSPHGNYQPPAPYAPPPPHSLRWLNVALVSEIRDLSDGVGISALFALYFSNEVRLDQIAVPAAGEILNLYEMTQNHGLIQKFCLEFFPERIYHLSVSDFLYVHGYMKQNILAFLIDLFTHLEVNPIVRVNRLTQVPLHVQL